MRIWDGTIVLTWDYIPNLMTFYFYLINYITIYSYIYVIYMYYITIVLWLKKYRYLSHRHIKSKQKSYHCYQLLSTSIPMIPLTWCSLNTLRSIPQILLLYFGFNICRVLESVLWICHLPISLVNTRLLFHFHYFYF